ncbi:pyridoxal phosphate-dependent transferase [Mycena capillaripes]|nr:pyridoxal phosphate-dependent transferase [Mycena capillaripes]
MDGSNRVVSRRISLLLHLILPPSFHASHANTLPQTATATPPTRMTPPAPPWTSPSSATAAPSPTSPARLPSFIASISAALKAAAKEGTKPKALVIINPGNPTGALLTAETMGELVRLYEEHSLVRLYEEHSLVLLAEEVHQSNLHDAAHHPFTSFKKVVRDPQSPVPLVSFHSISKGVSGDCGRRGGYFELTNVSEQVPALIYKLVSVGLCPGQIGVDSMVRLPKEGESSYKLWKEETDTIHAALAERTRVMARRLNALPGVSRRRRIACAVPNRNCIGTRSLMLSALEADRARVTAIEAEILDPEQRSFPITSSALQAERALAQERLDSYKYPVLTLPSEIVSEIFLHFLPTYPLCPPLTGLFSPILLTHICHEWREIALSTPMLWRAIAIPSSIERRAHIVETWLNRSGHCPLSIELNGRKAFEQPPKVFVSVILRRARWEYFNLTLDDAPPLSHLASFEGPTPLLKHLDLSIEQELYPLVTVTFPEAPLLRSVILDEDAAISVILPWAQLTSLTLG